MMKKFFAASALSLALFGTASADMQFERVSSFPVFLNTDIHEETVAEIVAASTDGMTLIYTDGATEKLGFVDIHDVKSPQAAGTVDLNGEPTSVAVVDNYALAAVNTSLDYVNTRGELVIIDIAGKSVVRTLALAGQPDSVAVSPDGKYAAVVIENERDEDLGDGAPPQMPAGLMQIVDLKGQPANWSLRNVDMTGLADLYPQDPEPEYVDINAENIAVVSLQENNHMVLLDLKKGRVLEHYSAGAVDLENIDTHKDKLLSMDSSLSGVLREPDGVSWISDRIYATANEGDLDGGSRGFTLFDKKGKVVYESAESVEHIIARHGHYPDKRAGKKGNEPENVEFGDYGADNKFLFVGSERSSVVVVYRVAMNGKSAPEFVQVLPTPVKPEGLLAIPSRGLFVSAGEKDARDDKMRSALGLYQLQSAPVGYPDVISADDHNGLPITWGALSALAMDADDQDVAYTVKDSFYEKSSIYRMDISRQPAVINEEIVLHDSMGVMAAVDASRVNGDQTVNLDPEGVATRVDGGFWMASEGKGTIGDANKPFEFENMLVRFAEDGLIEEVVTLPATTAARQVRFGFEGVASTGSGAEEMVYVAFQREWSGDMANHVRIGQYNTAGAEWKFFYYELDAVESAAGGWVGLSEIAYLGNDEFMVIERDNQGNTDAAIKRLYKFSINGLSPLADDGTAVAYPVVSKVLVDDLMDDLAATGGLTLEKIEGMAVKDDDTVLIINDNDGVDDSNGETSLLYLQGLLD